jgi:hypothetical protein
MNKIYVLQKDELGGELYRRIYLLISKNQGSRQSIGASVGLFGGLLSIILGSLLWAIVPFLVRGGFESFLNTVEILFFALSLPLLAVGVCCLDLLEKSPPILPLSAVSDFKFSGRYEPFRPQHPNNN